jgi:transmembrane sensor
MKSLDQPDDELMQQAAHWHAATRREDCDWLAFTEWLEAAPRHRLAYEEVALLEEHIARHAGALRAITATPAPRRHAGRWAAAAAFVALAAAGWLAYRVLPGWFAAESRVFTAQAQGSQVTLEGGVQVQLAPGSTLTVAGRRGQQLALRGGAWFDVPHDPRRELAISAGNYLLRDIGTRFELVSEGALLKVAVTDGEVAVVLPGDGAAVRLPAGRRLLVAGDPPIAEYGDVAATDVAGWREGRLVFRNEPMSLVAAQLGRHAGLDITVDTAVARRRFSGVLTLGANARPVEQLADIMGLRAERTGAAVRLVAADGQSPGR